MIGFILFFIAFVSIGLTISFYYLAKALYHFSLYKYYSLFSDDYKEYLRFSKDVKNIFAKVDEVKK